MKLLLVKENGDWIKSQLNENNIETIIAPPGEACFEILKKDESLDIVLYDFPDSPGDGLDFLSAIKNINADIPVVLLVKKVENHIWDAILTYAYDFIVTPFGAIDVDRLLIIIRNAVKIYRLQKEIYALQDYAHFISEYISSAIVSFDNNDKIELINSNALKLFGDMGGDVNKFDRPYLFNLINVENCDGKYYYPINDNTLGNILISKTGDSNSNKSLLVISEIDISILSDKEKKVLLLMLQNKSSIEIAREMDIDRSTVYVYKKRIQAKLKNKVDICLYKKI
jgi:DNA-binding CsgD family transcriptional regulator